MQPVRDKYYFLSDVHLGVSGVDTREHEAKFVSFLDSLPADTKALYLLGDIFDFWYEWKYAIPSGHTRALGKLAQVSDSGVEIYMFRGNHDIWLYHYFQDEIGAKILEQPSVVDIEGKKFCLGHGDGLGKMTFGFKFIRWIFYNPVIQLFFTALHPRWSLGLGYSWAAHSRKIKTGPGTNYKFSGKDSYAYHFAEDFGKGKNIDYFIFGHYHTPGEIDIPGGGHLMVLGDWINSPSYAIFDGKTLRFLANKC